MAIDLKKSSLSLSWVLVAEDDPQLASSLTTELSASGFKVVNAETAAEAISKASRQKFVCVLVDLKLERGSGEQIIDVMRKQVGNFNIKTPVIVMSGFLDPSVVKRLSSQVTAFMVKPFPPSEIVNKVKDVVAKAQNVASSIASHGKPQIA